MKLLKVKVEAFVFLVFFAFSSFGRFTKTEFCDYNNGDERYHTKK